MLFYLILLLSFDVPENYRLLDNSDSKLASKTYFLEDLKLLTLQAIKFYQQTISKVQGDVCNFVPSCSHFGYEAIERFGFIKGGLKASDRLQRCHGFAWFYLGSFYDEVFDSVRGRKLLDEVKP
ncbi:MAG: membrane protein insertion efficiency factor YidD [Candidatus Hydrothermia bacterium]